MRSDRHATARLGEVGVAIRAGARPDNFPRARIWQADNRRVDIGQADPCIDKGQADVWWLDIGKAKNGSFEIARRCLDDWRGIRLAAAIGHGVKAGSAIVRNPGDFGGARLRRYRRGRKCMGANWALKEIIEAAAQPARIAVSFDINSP
jgi:hypothetical protein